MTERDDSLSDTLQQQTNHSQRSSFAGVRKKAAIDPVALQNGLDALDLGADVEPRMASDSFGDSGDTVDLEPLDVLGESGIVGAVRREEDDAAPTEEFMPVVEEEALPAATEGLGQRIWRMLTGWMRV